MSHFTSVYQDAVPLYGTIWSIGILCYYYTGSGVDVAHREGAKDGCKNLNFWKTFLFIFEEESLNWHLGVSLY